MGKCPKCGKRLRWNYPFGVNSKARLSHNCDFTILTKRDVNIIKQNQALLREIKAG